MLVKTFKILFCGLTGLLFVSCGDAVKPKPEYLDTDRPVLENTGDTLEYVVTTVAAGDEADTLESFVAVLEYVQDTVLSGETYRVVSLAYRDPETRSLRTQEWLAVVWSGGLPSLQVLSKRSGSADPFRILALAGPTVSSLAQALLDRTAARSVENEIAVTRWESGSKTLSYNGSRESTVEISEVRMAAGDTLMTGVFWYGQSGLLQGTLEWNAFTRRGGDGGVREMTGLHQSFRLASN